MGLHEELPKLKGELHPKPTMSMLYVLPPNCQYFFQTQYDYLEAKCLKNSKIALKMSNGSEVIDYDMQNTDFINNSRITGLTKI